MTRSAPGRSTACAASGARSRWACSPAASTHAAGSQPDTGVPATGRTTTPTPSPGLFYGGGCKVLDGPVHRQLHHLCRHLRHRDGGLRRPQRREAAPHLQGRRNGRHGPPRAWHLGLPRVRHLGPGRPARACRATPSITPRSTRRRQRPRCPRRRPGGRRSDRWPGGTVPPGARPRCGRGVGPAGRRPDRNPFGRALAAAAPPTGTPPGADRGADSHENDHRHHPSRKGRSRAGGAEREGSLPDDRLRRPRLRPAARLQGDSSAAARRSSACCPR